MHLNKVEITNIRQFESIEVELNKNITLICGSNNSGKSTVLECIEFFSSKPDKFSFNDVNIKRRTELEKLECEKIINLSEIRLEIQFSEDDNISDFSDLILPNGLSMSNSIFVLLSYTISKEHLLNYNEDRSMDIQKKIEHKYSMCNKDYSIKFDVDKKTVQSIFNFKKIDAKRHVDDSIHDNNLKLTKLMMEEVKKHDQWNCLISEYLSKINDSLNKFKTKNGVNFEDAFNKSKEILLKNSLDDFNSTNGNNVDKINFAQNFEQKSLEKLIENSLKLKYGEGDIYLGESSQGLGYSNLLFMIFEINSYYSECRNNKINILCLEEPESHFHPAMERRFIMHLKKNLNNTVQTILSSHSKDIVSCANFSSIRLLQKTIDGSNIKNFEEFEKNQNPKTISFIKKFFPLSMVDSLFADKIVVFEGDCERIFLKEVINKDVELSKQYISYIQAGGRHIEQYIPFIKFLDVKTLIITDIDYTVRNFNGKHKKALENIEKISPEIISTNKFLTEYFATDSVENISDKVEENYDVSTNQLNICLVTQTNNEGYARSFEDAILFHNFKNSFSVTSCFENIEKEIWNTFHENNDLIRNNFTKMTNESSTPTNLLKRSYSVKKTEFIIDVLLSDLNVPLYIKRGLTWLK